jgi:hypothetical protein
MRTNNIDEHNRLKQEERVVEKRPVAFDLYFKRAGNT